MLRHEIRLGAASESEGVDEKKGKYDHDRAENAPPETLVHKCFCLLLAVDKVFHGEVEGGERPNVEGC